RGCGCQPRAAILSAGHHRYRSYPNKAILYGNGSTEKSRDPIRRTRSEGQDGRTRQALETQHASDDAVVTERVVDGAAQVHGDDGEQRPAGPQVDVGVEDVQVFVLAAPVGEV